MISLILIFGCLCRSSRNIAQQCAICFFNLYANLFQYFSNFVQPPVSMTLTFIYSLALIRDNICYLVVMDQNLMDENFSEIWVNEDVSLRKVNQSNHASVYSSALSTHLKTHSGEKSNKCNQCAYASSHALNFGTNLICSCKRAENTFENAQWRKVKEMQPIFIKFLQKVTVSSHEGHLIFLYL